MSNGEQVVLNSDSDSDSLPELDWGVPTTSSKTVAPTTRSKRTTVDDNDGLRMPEKRPKNKKRTFDHVFETAQKHREIEQLIAEHKADLDENEEEAAEFVFNEDALGQAVQEDDDPDQAHRLFLAMQRTNVTHEEHVFHFFHDKSDSIAVQSRFPADSLPNHRWTSNFRGATLLSALVSQVLIATRCVCSGPSFHDRLRPPGLSTSGAPRRGGFLDDRPE